MKRIFSGIAISALLSSTAYAQIPVTVTSDIPSVMNQIETMAKWAQQYQQMMTQIEQQRQQYQSLTGSRGLGNIMNDPALRNYLPGDWQSVYDSVKNGGYAGLTGSGRTVYNANKIFDGCAHITVADQRTACEARAVKPSQDKGFALDAYDMARNRINQIDGLMARINQTNDPKAIAELQGRIAVEQANIQNEQTKLQLYAMIAAAEDKVQAQRDQEMQARTWNASGGIVPQPVTFGR